MLMAPLLLLPIEIRVIIPATSSDGDLSDTGNLGVTCTQLYSIIYPRLEFALHIVDARGDEPQSHDKSTLHALRRQIYNLLLSILRCRWLRTFVRSAQLNSWRIRCSDMSDYMDADDIDKININAADVILFEKALRWTGAGLAFERWSGGFAGANAEAGTAALLLLLPNLRSIAATNIAKPFFLDAVKSAISVSPLRSFAKLASLRTEHWFNKHGIQLIHIWPFVSMPSLTCLHGWCISVLTSRN